MDLPSPSLRSLPLAWIAILLAIVLVGVGLWTTRARPISPPTEETRAELFVSARPPMAIAEGAAPGINQLGESAEPGAVGPSDPGAPPWAYVIVPAIELKETTVWDSLEALRSAILKANPPGGGVTYIFTELEEETLNKRLSVRLSEVPAIVVLKYITDLSGLSSKVEGNIVRIAHIGYFSDKRLMVREFKVSGDLFTRPASTGTKDNGFFKGPGGINVVGGATTAKQVLTAAGVDFSIPGSSAVYLPSSSKLVVRHTQQNLDLIESMGGGCEMTEAPVVQPIPDLPLFK